MIPWLSTFFKVSKENNTEFEKAAEAVEIPKLNPSEEEKSDNQGGPEKLDDSEFTGEENDINNLLEDESGESIREISNKLEGKDSDNLSDSIDSLDTTDDTENNTDSMESLLSDDSLDNIGGETLQDSSDDL